MFEQTADRRPQTADSRQRRQRESVWRESVPAGVPRVKKASTSNQKKRRKKKKEKKEKKEKRKKKKSTHTKKAKPPCRDIIS